MGSKIIIDKKEYTERTVDSLQINGTTISNNIIDTSSLDNSYIVEVNINTGVEMQVSSESKSIDAQSIDIESIESNKTKETASVEKVASKSLISRFIEFIKNLFKR